MEYQRPVRIGTTINNAVRTYRAAFVPIAVFSIAVGALSRFIVSAAVGMIPAVQRADELLAGLSTRFLDAASNAQTDIAASYLEEFWNGLDSTAAGDLMLWGFCVLASMLISGIIISPFVNVGINSVAYGHGEKAPAGVWLRRMLPHTGRIIWLGFCASLMFCLAVIVLVFSAAAVSTLMTLINAQLGVLIIALLTAAVFVALFALEGIYYLCFSVAAVEGRFGFAAVRRAVASASKAPFKLTLLVLCVRLITMLIDMLVGGAIDMMLPLATPVLLLHAVHTVLTHLLTPVIIVSVLLAYMEIR